jgi:hypothetical protein
MEPKHITWKVPQVFFSVEIKPPKNPHREKVRPAPQTRKLRYEDLACVGPTLPRKDFFEIFRKMFGCPCQSSRPGQVGL